MRAPIEIRKRRSSWCVYIGEQLISDHATRDGAATAANQLIEAENTEAT